MADYGDRIASIHDILKNCPVQEKAVKRVAVKQGDYQDPKRPRTTTPNTSRKMPTDSIQIAAVTSIKNHSAKQPDDVLRKR